MGVPARGHWHSGWGLVEGAALEGGVGGGCCGLAGGVDDDGVGEPEADEGFGGDLHLLTLGDGLCSGAESTACCCADGCALSSTEDAAEDGADGCTAADFFGGIFAAASTFLAEGVSGYGDAFTFGVDAGEFDGEEGRAFEVGCFVDFADASGDGGSLRDGCDAFNDKVGGKGSGEGFALLGGRAIEGLGDADGDGGSGGDGDVADDGLGGSLRLRRWWGYLRLWANDGCWLGLVGCCLCGWLDGGLGCGRLLFAGGWFAMDVALGFWGLGHGCWRRGLGCGLDGEIVDDGADAVDLSGVVGGEGACCFAADVAVEGGDTVLDGGLDGFAGDGGVGGDALLEGGGQGSVVGLGGGWRGALAAGEAEADCQSGDGGGGIGGGVEAMEFHKCLSLRRIRVTDDIKLMGQ